MPTGKTVLVQLNSLALGGTQLNAVDLAWAVESFGYRSVLYGPADSLPRDGTPNLLDSASSRGLKIEPYERARGVLRRGANALDTRASQIGADIVHVYGADAEPRTAFWGPCRGGRRPFVHTIYEMSVDANAYSHNSLIIGTGYLRDELAGRPGPTALISPPVDTIGDSPNRLIGEQFREGRFGRDQLLIVIVSRLDKWMKAYPVETAIRAMAYLADTGAALVVVGSGTEEGRLMELGTRINQLAGRNLVEFTGAMADPRPAYAAADIALGMGGSAARSLAFGCPLVVQGEFGTSEVFHPESSASLYRRSFWNPGAQPNAAENLADILAELINAPARRRELSDFGRYFAEETFSLNAMSERLASVYDRSLTSYGRMSWLRDLNHEVPELAKSLRRRLDRVADRRRPKVLS